MLKKIFANLLVILVGGFLCTLVMIFPIALWGSYEYWAYRYVVVSSEGGIYDKMTRQYLIIDGQSFYKDDDYIYAYKEGIFLIIDNRILNNHGGIIVYIDKDGESSRRLQRINNKYYDKKIRVIFDKTQLTSRQIDIYTRLKNTSYNFIPQGIM